MNTTTAFSSAAAGLMLLASCALPENRSTLMHGKVRGGDVPLYVMGGLHDFVNAGIVLPSLGGGYLRTEYEVLDMGVNGKLTPAMSGEMNPTAQLAIPLLVSSFNLPSGYEAKYALAPYDKLGSQSSLAGGVAVTPPKAIPVEDECTECIQIIE